MPIQYNQQLIELTIAGIKEYGRSKYKERIVFGDWYFTTICNEIILHVPYRIDNREIGEYTAEL
jgi:hypothetical protein